MTNRVSVAVVGATGVVGESLLTALEARSFPVETLYCLDEGEAISETLRYFGKSVKVESIAEFDFSRVRLVFFCGDAALTARYADLAGEAGCMVIDCSGALGAEHDIPLVIPAINPQVLEAQQNRIVATPSAITLALQLVLRPLHEAVGIERVNLTVLEPVSIAGKDGIDELAAQTVALLNMKETRSRVFSQQIAFNLIPQVGLLQENGYTDGEMRVISETRKMLGEEEFELNPTIVLVPVFYGYGMNVQLVGRGHLSSAEAVALLSEAPGVSVREDDVPTPVGEATKGEMVYVGRVREDLTDSRGLNLWITLDNVRTGTALNAVQIAELWEKCYM